MRFEVSGEGFVDIRALCLLLFKMTLVVFDLG